MVSIIPCWVNLSGTSFRIGPCQGGLQRDVVYLGWPIALSDMNPNAGERGGGRVAGSQPLSIQLHTGAQINFGDLTPCLTYGPRRVNVIPCWQHEFEPHFGYSTNPESKSENLQENPEGEFIETSPCICRKYKNKLATFPSPAGMSQTFLQCKLPFRPKPCRHAYLCLIIYGKTKNSPKPTRLAGWGQCTRQVKTRNLFPSSLSPPIYAKRIVGFLL